MKCTFLTFCILLAGTAFCQSIINPLLLRDNQEFLTYTQRNVPFPHEAIRKGVTAKVCVGFKLNEQGTIQDISILNPQPANNSFEKEIILAFKRLPKQASMYRGDYAVTYSFGYRDDPENAILTTRLNPELIGRRQLLPEVKLRVSVFRPQRQASITSVFRLPFN